MKKTICLTAILLSATATAEAVFGDFAQVKWYTWAVLAALLALGIALCVTRRRRWSARQVSYAAMCIAISFVLSCVKVFRFPQGGSVTPGSMLPLILFALAFGPAKGLAVGCAYGILQLIEDPYVIHPLQLLCDYPLAYGTVIAGCAALLIPENRSWLRLPLAVILAYAARLCMATLSGVVFFAEYAGEQNVWLYSLLYNGGYLVWDMLIAAAIAALPGMNRLLKMLRGT